MVSAALFGISTPAAKRLVAGIDRDLRIALLRCRHWRWLFVRPPPHVIQPAGGPTSKLFGPVLQGKDITWLQGDCRWGVRVPSAEWEPSHRRLASYLL